MDNSTLQKQMKVNRKEASPDFMPFTLEIEIENKEEAQAFYAIFNLGKNRDLLSCPEAEKIKQLIGKEFYVGSGGIISNGVNYTKFYN